MVLGGCSDKLLMLLSPLLEFPPMMKQTVSPMLVSKDASLSTVNLQAQRSQPSHHSGKAMADDGTNALGRSDQAHLRQLFSYLISVNRVKPERFDLACKASCSIFHSPHRGTYAFPSSASLAPHCSVD